MGLNPAEFGSVSRV